MAEVAAGAKSGKVVIRNIGLMLSGDIDQPDPRRRHHRRERRPDHRGRQARTTATSSSAQTRDRLQEDLRRARA